MAELFEEVVSILESRSSTRALADQFRIESEEAASNGAVLGVPVFLESLNRWAKDPTSSATLLQTLRSIDTAGLQDPGAALEARTYEPVGSELADMLLGDRRARVASVISGEAGISERSADGLLPPTAWAVMASIADRYGNRIDRQSLISVLAREQSDLLDGGWGPWLDATAEQSPAEAAAVSTQSTILKTATAVNTADMASQQVGGGSYPPPVARSARLVQDEPQTVVARSGGRPANGRSPVVTGQPSQRRSTVRADPERVRPVERPSRWPLLIGLLLVLLLVAAAVYWLLLRDDDTGGDGVATENATDAEVVDDSVPVAPAQLVPIDVIMDDPEGRSTSTGVAELRFNVEAGEVCYNVTVTGMDTPYDGHIHVGPAGVKGGIVVDFGPLNNADIGCVDVSQNELAAILADLPGHYVEMHDPGEAFTIRAQLSDAMPEEATPAPDDAPAEDALFDPSGGGATTVIESGRIILRGEVADQETLDRLAAEFTDVSSGELEIVNELTIVEGAPLPSGLITIDDSVLFDVNSDQLLGDGQTAIADLATVFRARPDWQVTIVGHTDSTGSEVYNLELSLRRAEAVRDELVANGVPADSLRIEGAGATDPVADNATPQGRALNRRIEFKVDRG